MKLPILFVSHGAPSLAIAPGETGLTWQKIAAQLPQPEAILVISAHWDSIIPTLTSTLTPATIHDFSGFDKALYQMHYPAPGAPKLAQLAAQHLAAAGINSKLDAQRGLDHGAWIPLGLLFPAANIPVCQLSIQAQQTPAHHYALGRSLQALSNQGVLIIASGSLTHNLSAISRAATNSPTPAWVSEFCAWMSEKIAQGQIDALLNYRTLAPHALENHPTDEHLLPLFVALGAAHNIRHHQHLNQLFTYQILAMDSWLFNPA